jgi:hypothetical protein
MTKPRLPSRSQLPGNGSGISYKASLPVQEEDLALLAIGRPNFEGMELQPARTFKQ